MWLNEKMKRINPHQAQSSQLYTITQLKLSSEPSGSCFISGIKKVSSCTLLSHVFSLSLSLHKERLEKYNMDEITKLCRETVVW